MRPLWHPLSTILLADPPCWATTRVLALLLAVGPVRVRYGGDRMWPALRHGATFDVERPGSVNPRPGETWLVPWDGIPDLLRVERCEGESVRLSADADPWLAVNASPGDLLGRARLASERVSRGRARWNRLRCELHEAATGRPDQARDPAATVEQKYTAQAEHYGRSESRGLDPLLAERFTRRVPAGARVLVVGSGTGPECFTLAERGYRVSGIDFSAAMVELARGEAARRMAPVSFTTGDVRALRPEPGSLDAVLFTYDVYSFLPRADERVAVLRALGGALALGGVVFLSARRAGSPWERLVLTRQWLARRDERPRPSWGASHTRWIAADGSLRRSFVHVFTRHRLRDEAVAAGLGLEEWGGAHGAFSPRAADQRSRR